MPDYKPADYSTVSPYLIVDGAAATIDFLKAVLGATELRRFSDDSGRVHHAEVRIDDSVIMLADPVPPDWPAFASHVHVYVPDVDATYRKALAAGAVTVQEPVQKQDEDKRGGVKDTGGTTWWISTRVG
jgi:PhnB protein